MIPRRYAITRLGNMLKVCLVLGNLSLTMLINVVLIKNMYVDCFDSGPAICLFHIVLPWFRNTV